MIARMLLAALLAAAGPAAAEDLHQLWDQRCGACHGHAGIFARDTLRVVDGQLQDRAGRDVVAFLVGHNGGYSAEHIAAITAMLRTQAQTPDLFRRVCAECHDTAADLVRQQVVVRDGMLVGRASGRPLAEFLRRHGDLEEGEVAVMLEVLGRIEREIHHP